MSIIVKLKRDLVKFFNLDLSTYLIYNEIYTINIIQTDNTIEVECLSGTGYSSLSRCYDNPIESNLKIIYSVEDKLETYFIENIPRYDADSFRIQYEYNGIILAFELEPYQRGVDFTYDIITLCM